MNIHPTAKRFGIAAAITLASFATSSTYAQLLAYEGFDLTNTTDLNGNGSGTGWGSNTWTGTNVYDSTSPGLSYTDGSDALATTGIKAQASGVVTNTSVLRLFNTPVTITQGSTYYYSLILNAAGGATGGNIVQFVALDDNTISDAAFTFGNIFNNANARLRPNGGGSSYVDTSVAAASTNFFVIKITFDLVGTNPETISIFANPDIGGAEPIATITDSTLDITATTLNGVGFQTVGTNSKDLLADEIRFGTTWTSVTPVPEPSTVALLFGAAMFVLFRLRRRQSATQA